MKKHFISVIIVVMAVLSMSGCGQQEQRSTEQEIDDEIVIEVYAGQGEKENLDFLASAFEKEHDEVSIRVHLVPDSEYTQQMMQIKNREVQADCIFFPNVGEAVIWKKKKILKDITPWYQGTEEEEYYRSWHESMEQEDVCYMLPYRIGKVCVYYNKTLFDKQGVDYPKEGWTWEDYKETAKKLTGWSDNKKVYGALGFAGNNLWWTFPARTRGAVDAFNEYDLEMFCESAAWCYACNNEFATTFPYIEWGDGEGYSFLFLEGRLGMYFGEDSEVNVLNREIQRQELELKYDVAELPVWNGEKGMEIYNTAVVAMAEISEHPEWAYQFMEFCVGQEGGRILAENSMVPSWQSSYIQDIYLSCTPIPEHAECFLNDEVFAETAVDVLYNESMEVMQNEVRLYMMGEQELDYTFENVEAALRELKAR